MKTKEERQAASKAYEASKDRAYQQFNRPIYDNGHWREATVEEYETDDQRRIRELEDRIAALEAKCAGC